MPYPAAIERSVSPGPTTCASSAGGSSRMAVIGACRAYRTGRGGSYSRVTSGAARGSPQATAATRVSSFAPATVATGAKAATTMQVAVAAVWAHRRIAPRLLALLVAHAVALPIELGPRVALLCLDVAAKLDAFARKLHQETRGRVHVRAAEERAPPRVGQIAAILRARDADVTEAALL